VPFFRLTVNDPRWLKIFHTTIEFEHPIQADYRVYQKKPLFPLEKLFPFLIREAGNRKKLKDWVWKRFKKRKKVLLSLQWNFQKF